MVSNVTPIEEHALFMFNTERKSCWQLHACIYINTHTYIYVYVQKRERQKHTLERQLFLRFKSIFVSLRRTTMINAQRHTR